MEAFVKLEIADDSHNAELSRFYSQFPVRYAISKKVKEPAIFNYERTDFFAPYKMLGDSSTTFMLRSAKNQLIQVVATFVVKTIRVPGSEHLHNLALAMDLRVANNREAILHWSHHFLPALEEVKKQLQCEYVMSYLNLAESTALNALIRPRNLRRPLPKYHLYRRLNLTSVHGFFPWAPRALKSLSVRRAEGPQLQEKLLVYLAHQWKKKNLTEDPTPEGVHRALQRISGFKISDFLVALSKDDRIVGCAAPWSSALSQTQKIIPLTYGAQGENLSQFLQVSRFLGWTKPLPETGSPMEFCYLLHLHADNEDIFESMIQAIYRRQTPTSFLVYSWLEDDFQSSPPKGSVSVTAPFGLYGILAPEDPIPGFLSPSFEGEPEIEGFLF
jgi:hypothetical protein